MGLKIRIRGLCRPYLTFYDPLDIYSNNIVIISLVHSRFPLSLWKDDDLSISLNEERKASPLPEIVFLDIICTNLIVLGRLTLKISCAKIS